MVLATAHPCKFPDVFEELNIQYDIPAQVEELYQKVSLQKHMKNSFEDFKTHLMV